MKSEQKALQACKEYDRLMLAIKRNTDEIGTGLEECCRWSEGEFGQRYMSDNQQYHLSDAFQPYEGDGDMFAPVRYYNEEPTILEIIGDCEGCLKAYKAIQERKANKKKLGIVKRAIRMIGRAA